MNLSLIRTIAWHEFFTNVRRPAFIFVTLLFPTLGALGLAASVLFGGAAGDFMAEQFDPMAAATQPLGLVDNSGLLTPIPAKYAEEFQAFATEAEGLQALTAKDIRGLVVVPANYVANGQVRGYLLEGGGFTSLIALDSDAMRAYFIEQLLAGQVPPERIARVIEPNNLETVTVDETGQPVPDTNLASTVSSFVVPYVMTILLIVSIFSASNYLLRSVSEEKETRVIEVVLSSVSAAELLAGKVLGLGGLGLVQVAVWLGAGMVLSGGLGMVAAVALMAFSPQVTALALVYFVLGYLLFGTLMAAAGSLGTSARESQQLAGVFSFMAAVPLMFNSLVLFNPNGPLPRALSYFPLTAPTMMMLRLPMTQVPVEDIVISIVGLVVAVPAAMWASGKVFRVGLLIYGKRPSLKEIWHILRAA